MCYFLEKTHFLYGLKRKLDTFYTIVRLDFYTFLEFKIRVC